MSSRAVIEDFLSQKTLAVVGVSRRGAKFGNAALRELRARGYRVLPVHPEAESLEGERCYASLAALPEPVGGVLIAVPPRRTEQVVREAAQAGIRRVWMQQGADSAEAVRFCKENGIDEVHGECVLMFTEPARFPHRQHRWVWKMLGKLPK